MLHNMHYRVGKDFQQKEEKQIAAKKETKNYSEVHWDYSCVRIEHQRTDILSASIPRSVIEVRKEMVTKKEQGRGKDVLQICRIESIFTSTAEHAG